MSKSPLDPTVAEQAPEADDLTAYDREHLVTNIVAHASDGVSADVQARVITYWTNVDAELGSRVAAGLGYGNAATSAAA